MVIINMNLTLPKVIKNKVCLWAKGPYGLSKDLGPKSRPNTWRKEESKEIRDSVKVEDGGVHCNRYDGRCTKQRGRIPKATWTSPILGKWFTCWTSFINTFLMRDNAKVKVFTGILEILIPSNGLVNWDGVLKSGGRPKGDHATHF
jgi:hypothetical protein